MSDTTHFYLLTLDLPGKAQAGFSGELTIRPGTPRMEVYVWVREQATEKYPEMAKANTVFFYLESANIE